MKPILLIVTGDKTTRESFRLALGADHDLTFVEGRDQVLQALRNQTFDLCFWDPAPPDGNAPDLLQQLKRKDPFLDVVVAVPPQNVDAALEWLRWGAYDYLPKPFHEGDLQAAARRVLQKKALERENRFLRAERPVPERAYLLGESRTLKELMEKIRSAAVQEAPVLLTGESGTGAEEAAWTLHDQSARREGPFVKVFCAAVSKSKLESDLWGREADFAAVGKLESAGGGTLFLEQADHFPPELQDRLLRAFLENKISRMNKAPLPASIRVVASVAEGTTHGVGGGLGAEFQRFFNGSVLRLPPLRERKQDIPQLLQHFLKAANLKSRTSVKAITPEAVQFLTDYPWPGNVRELENSVETMLVSPGREVLTLDDVPLDLLVRRVNLAGTKKEAKLYLKRVRRQFERQYIRKALEKTHGHQIRAAAALGLHRNTLIWKLKKLNLQDDYRLIVRKRREQGLGFRSL